MFDEKRYKQLNRIEFTYRPLSDVAIDIREIIPLMIKDFRSVTILGELRGVW